MSGYTPYSPYPNIMGLAQDFLQNMMMMKMFKEMYGPQKPTETTKVSPTARPPSREKRDPTFGVTRMAAPDSLQGQEYGAYKPDAPGSMMGKMLQQDPQMMAFIMRLLGGLQTPYRRM